VNLHKSDLYTILYYLGLQVLI